ncbi:MAG: XRE family transcriptional regulator [Streptomyces sp.]|nr:XRE family transcriptional regulator [Streptomyces sp.]
METPQSAASTTESFDDVLADIKDAEGVSDSEIARRMELHVSTVNNWALGKAIPRQNALLGLAALFPKYKRRLFQAAGRKPTAPLTPNRRERVLKMFDRLTEEQQDIMLIQGEALGDSNRQQS